MLKKIIAISILSLLLLTGCEFFFGPSGISASDPYDADCNLKDSYHKDWKKYSDIDYRIAPMSRSYEAQQYYVAVDRITEIGAKIHTLERDRAIRTLMIDETKTYKASLASGHKKNLIKSFIRMSFYTTEVIYNSANVGKGFAKTFLDPSKSGVQLVGEALKIADSFAPSNSSLALDTATTEGKIQDVAKSGWLETLTTWGTKDSKDVSKNMAKKVAGYVQGEISELYPGKGVKYTPLPEITLSDADFAILKNEHLKLHELDNLIQDSEKKNFEQMWEIRVLEQEKTNLKNSLFDLEYDEKARVDGMLIAE
ncbi:MAG: hypothetical protein KAQ83_01425, partial [Nanoarchaeota archaeon]|nr:hypothetical protein [Nanoarchaeota archaeon]